MTLEFNISQLLKSETGANRTYEFRADVPLDLGDARATDIAGNVKFVLTNYGVLASVIAHATLHQTCARCLEEFEKPVDVQFEDEYRPTIDIGSGKTAETLPSDTAFSISSSHTIDLTEALRQNLVLAIEIVPICKNDCAGLCPTCGVNRNVEACDCPTVETASPFAELEALLGSIQVQE